MARVCAQGVSGRAAEIRGTRGDTRRWLEGMRGVLGTLKDTCLLCAGHV